MPCEPEDVLRAAQTLAWQNEPASTDAIALLLRSTRDGVNGPTARCVGAARLDHLQPHHAQARGIQRHGMDGALLTPHGGA
jgi:hypothetical protein